MIRFLKFLPLPMLIFIVAIGATTLIGRASPVPEQVAALHLGDMCELPCWIGITPGKTTLQESKEILSRVYFQGKPVPLVDEVADSYAANINGRFVVDVVARPRKDSDYPAGTIASITLSQLDGLRLPLGYLTDNLIRPEYVPQYANDWDRLTVLNRWAEVSFLRDDVYGTNVNYDEFQRIQGITMVQFISWIRLTERKSNDTTFDYHSKWRGFGFYLVMDIPYGED